ncbi:hypothetical protein ASPFODRAFT_380790 [Aspergillus luchuensis CBS 106.47]|uniref:Uncharacterized protein n=1 Tax=Aspergillus luchuensis (strain CBS 106.47) TaxID=1137211 RepID=A0A1M3T4P5_ASPLC|nr:hypothetical protein ASPFODRAFT_380790 [Aspergillus luchuensis CBS 106.47]
MAKCQSKQIRWSKRSEEMGCRLSFFLISPYTKTRRNLSARVSNLGNSFFPSITEAAGSWVPFLSRGGASSAMKVAWTHEPQMQLPSVPWLLRGPGCRFIGRSGYTTHHSFDLRQPVSTYMTPTTEPRAMTGYCGGGREAWSGKGYLFHPPWPKKPQLRSEQEREELISALRCFQLLVVYFVPTTRVDLPSPRPLRLVS